MSTAFDHPEYNYKVVRQFAVMTVVWGIVGMLVGVLIASQLAWPALNFDLPWLHFGRLRPLHTNAVIFAFGGSALTSVDSQETVVVLGAGARCKVRDKLQLKAEYVNRDDAQNGGSDGTAYYGQAGYRVHPMLEPLLKYENLDVSDNNKDQANFTFGLNIFLNPAKQNESKIQFNYVLSDLDGGDAFQVLVQGAF